MDTTVLVAIIGACGVILAAIIAGVFALKKRDNPSQSSTAEDGSYAISAGRDVHIGELPEKRQKSPSELEITDVSFTHDSEFDIKVRNLGDDAIIIHRISILMVKDYQTGVLPILEPSAKYEIPVNGLRENQSRYLDVSHVVDGHKADRFSIALQTTNIYLLRVTFHYNTKEKASFEMQTWDTRGNSLKIMPKE